MVPTPAAISEKKLNVALRSRVTFCSEGEISSGCGCAGLGGGSLVGSSMVKRAFLKRERATLPKSDSYWSIG
jgi:hypothetical protein